MPTLGLGPRLPHRRPGAQRPAGLRLRRPRRRPGQARRSPDRARRDRRRSCCGLPGVVARRRRRPLHESRATSCWSATSPSTRRTTRPPPSRLLRARLPAALVPRLAVVDDLPTRTSGKVDRDALPWPLPGHEPARLGLRGHGRRGSRSCGSTCSAPMATVPRATTSSTSAAAASPPPRWSRCCASATPRSRSATSTTTRRSARSPTALDDLGTRHRQPTATSVRPDAAQDPGRAGRWRPRRCGRCAGPRWLTWLVLAASVVGAGVGPGLAADVPVVVAGPGRRRGAS